MNISSCTGHGVGFVWRWMMIAYITFTSLGSIFGAAHDS